MSSQQYAYYPGCTLRTTAKEYDVSARLVCEAIDVKLNELKDWACCGASSAHTSSHLLSIALPARDLQTAEEMGLPVVAPCAMCFSRLKSATHELADPGMRDTISRIVGKELYNMTKVMHLLQVLDEKSENLLVKKPLDDLTPACYYGCLLTRPKDITDFDDPENPQIMDQLLGKLGAESISWAFKTECCGASMPLTRHDMVLKLSHRILSQAKQGGADCIVVACPMCHSNLDTYQREMRREYRDETNMPVVYFTQLIGLALGFSPRELLLDKHFTDTLPLLKAKGLA